MILGIPPITWQLLTKLFSLAACWRAADRSAARSCAARRRSWLRRAAASARRSVTGSPA
jgi:hypothetical protein